MSRGLSIVILLSALIICRRAKAQQQTSDSQTNQPIELSLGNITPLHAVLQIAAQYKVPFGIAFGARPSLCNGERAMTIRAENLSDALSQATRGTGYTITRYGDAYVLLAADLTE